MNGLYGMGGMTRTQSWALWLIETIFGWRYWDWSLLVLTLWRIGITVALTYLVFTHCNGAT